MSTPAQQSPTDRHRPHGFLWYTNWLFLLLLVYALSIGPVAWLERNGLPSRFYYAFYKPLAVLCAHSALANQLFGWYIGRVWGLADDSA